MKQSMEVLTSSETNEWYTNPEIIEMVRKVLGSIDTDPASHPIPQRWIRARKFYTEQDSGLDHIWYGRVFLNPPYGTTGGKSNQGIWSLELLGDIALNHCSHAIMLTKTVPGYAWWDNLFHVRWPGPCCITMDRLAFVKPEWVTLDDHRGYSITIPERVQNTQGKWIKKDWRSKAASTLWYYGPDPDKFNEVFSKIGRVIPKGNLWR